MENMFSKVMLIYVTLMYLFWANVVAILNVCSTLTFLTVGLLHISVDDKLQGL